MPQADYRFSKAIRGTALDWVIYTELDDLTNDLESIYIKHITALRMDINKIKVPYTRLREQSEQEKHDKSIGLVINQYVHSHSSEMIDLLYVICNAFYPKRFNQGYFDDLIGFYPEEYQADDSQILKLIIRHLMSYRQYTFYNFLKLYKSIIEEDAR